MLHVSGRRARVRAVAEHVRVRAHGRVRVVRQEHDAVDVYRGEGEHEYRQNGQIQPVVELRTKLSGRVQRVVDGVAARERQRGDEPIVQQNDASIQGYDEAAHELRDEHGLHVDRVD